MIAAPVITATSRPTQVRKDMDAHAISQQIIMVFGLCTSEPIYGSKEQVTVTLEGEDPVTFYRKFLLLNSERIEMLREEAGRVGNGVISDDTNTKLNQLTTALDHL